MIKFAANTKVPVAQTRGDISAIIGKYGGALLDMRDDIPGRTQVMFRSNHRPPRHLRTVLNWPVNDVQVQQRKWRALLRDIQAKFIAVDEGIETFDQAFLAWIIGADGKTMFEKAQELRLLPSPGDKDAA